MPKWPNEPEQFNVSNINGGNMYDPGDGLTADDVNSIVNGMLYILKKGPIHFEDIAQTLEGNEQDKVPSVRAVSDKLNEKFDKEKIVHSTGNSESAVMSQKAVTQELNPIRITTLGINYDFTAEGTGNKYFDVSIPSGTKVSITANVGDFNLNAFDASGTSYMITPSIHAGRTIEYTTVCDVVKVGGWFTDAASSFTITSQGLADKIETIEDTVEDLGQEVSEAKKTTEGLADKIETIEDTVEGMSQKIDEAKEAMEALANADTLFANKLSILENGIYYEVTATGTGNRRFSVSIPSGTTVTITVNEGNLNLNAYGANGETATITGAIKTGQTKEYTTAFDVIELGGWCNTASTSLTVKSEGLADKIDGVKNDIEVVKQEAVEAKKWNNAININFASQDQNTGTCADGYWSLQGKHCIIPISYGMRVKVHANKEYDTGVFFVSDYSVPTTIYSPFYKVATATVSADTTETIRVPYGSKYVLVNVVDVNLIDRLPQALSLEFDKEFAEVYRNAKTKSVSVQFGTPITILANNDEEAVEEEKLLLSYFNIVQLSDKMYYLYYAAYGEGVRQEYNQNLLFAYSTDGIHYTRGFPEGINPPFEGTNKIFSNANTTNFTGQNIFKCLDPEYPWRMVCQQHTENGEDNVYMIKSKDGINFDESTRRMLQHGIKYVNGTAVQNFHDTQYGVVCRGNIIKFFSRNNVNYHIAEAGKARKSREITVAFYDLDGNTILPEKNLPLRYVYNSAAVPFDDRRELIFPTGFGMNSFIGGVQDQTYTLNAYVVDGNLVNEVETNISSVIEADDKWITFAPSMITIGDDQYLVYQTRDFEHDTSPTFGVNVSRYRIVPVVIDRE